MRTIVSFLYKKWVYHDNPWCYAQDSRSLCNRMWGGKKWEQNSIPKSFDLFVCIHKRDSIDSILSGGRQARLRVFSFFILDSFIQDHALLSIWLGTAAAADTLSYSKRLNFSTCMHVYYTHQQQGWYQKELFVSKSENSAQGIGYIRCFFIYFYSRKTRFACCVVCPRSLRIFPFWMIHSVCSRFYL